jgi:large repetitive protein
VHCGQVITASIRLANDLADCPADGLLIGADRITVDLNSHTIDGVLGSDVGAGIDNAAGHSGVRVRNGTVSEFSVAIQMSGAADAVQRIAVHGYFQAGIRFAGAAGGEVEGCEVAGGSEGSGIVLAASDGVQYATVRYPAVRTTRSALRAHATTAWYEMCSTTTPLESS